MASAVTQVIVATTMVASYAYYFREIVPLYLKGLKYDEAASKAFNRVIELRSERKFSK